MLLEDSPRRDLDLLEHHVITPKVRNHLQDTLRIILVKQGSIEDIVMEDEASISGEVHIHHLDIRVTPAYVVLA